MSDDNKNSIPDLVPDSGYQYHDYNSFFNADLSVSYATAAA
jgi:hypothetical protein